MLYCIVVEDGAGVDAAQGSQLDAHLPQLVRVAARGGRARDLERIAAQRDTGRLRQRSYELEIEYSLYAGNGLVQSHFTLLHSVRPHTTHWQRQPSKKAVTNRIQCCPTEG